MPIARMRRGVFAGFCFLAVRAAPGQTSVFYPSPPAASLLVSEVQFGAADGAPLRTAVYRARAAAATLQPALIFFFPKFAPDQPRSPFLDAWARVAAAHGLVALVPDIRFGQEAADLDRFLDYLQVNGHRHGADRDAIAVYAGSGPGATAFPILQNPQLTRVKAATLFYAGETNLTSFRHDLPILFVRAGLDRPEVNRAFDAMLGAMLAQNAPVSVINDAAGYHAFEGRNDDAVTRAVIDEAIQFVKRTTRPAYQAALRTGLAEAAAAGHMTAGHFTAAAAAYADLVRARPNETTLRLAYGEALLGARQFGAACSEFAQLKGKGLGPRDLGVPAARACALNGDAAAAIAWLASIPKRFLPPRLESDSAFAALRDRPEFKALFVP